MLFFEILDARFRGHDRKGVFQQPVNILSSDAMPLFLHLKTRDSLLQVKSLQKKQKESHREPPEIYEIPVILQDEFSDNPTEKAIPDFHPAPYPYLHKKRDGDTRKIEALGQSTRIKNAR